MAERIARSMNHELLDGSCDGTYKRVAPDRTNIEFPTKEQIRSDRSAAGLDWPFGVSETRHKLTPLGHFVTE